MRISRRHARVTVKSLVLASLAAGVFACSAGADDEGLAEQEKRVKPVGNETFTTGAVTIKVPGSSPTLAPTRVSLVGARSAVSGNLNETLNVPPGTYEIQVAGSNAATVFGSVTVVGGQATSVTLPVLAPVALSTPLQPANLGKQTFTWGPSYAPINGSARADSPAIRLAGAGSVYANPIGTNLGIVLVPGATYEIVRPGSAGPTVLASLNVPTTPAVHSLPPVSVAWRALTQTAPTMEIEVVADPFDFRPSFAPTIRWDCGAVYDDARNIRTEAPLRSIAAAVSVTSVRFAGQTVKNTVATAGCRYWLNTLAGDIPIDTTQPKVSVPVHTIDVEHVHVTHTNGSVRDVPGRYRVSRVPGPGQAPVSLTGAVFAYPTETSVAVAAGTYLIEVQYTDNAGPQVYSTQVTVP